MARKLPTMIGFALYVVASVATILVLGHVAMNDEPLAGGQGKDAVLVLGVGGSRP